jgi:hypothetical protein
MATTLLTYSINISSPVITIFYYGIGSYITTGGYMKGLFGLLGKMEVSSYLVRLFCESVFVVF